MRATLFTTLTAAVSLSLTPAHAGDDPRVVVERAVQALGGCDALRQARAMLSKLTGVLHEDELPNAPFTAEISTQYPDRFRLTLTVSMNAGQKLVLVQILDRDRAYLRDEDSDREPEPEELADMQLSAYVDNVATLLPLLEDKAYKLASAGEIAVQDKPALGVRVSAEGRPDVLLYFDKATSLLVKTEYRRPGHGKKAEAHKEEFLSDYREVDLVSADVQALKAAGVATDDASLLAYLGARTLPEARRSRIQTLVRKLGDPSFETREAAQAELTAEGPPALPLVARAANDPDPEVARRARECLDKIGKSPDMAVPAAVARLLAQRRAAGAAEGLLAYLPSAPDESVAHEVRSALAALAAAGGPSREALEKARADANPERRAAAEKALAADTKPPSEGPGERLFPKGLRHATVGVAYRDGKKVVDWKLTEVQFFRHIDDRVFAKP